MTAQPIEHDTAEQGDRYLAAYASVHSLLGDLEIEPVAQGAAASTTPGTLAAPIPAARLAHSSGGRRKLKRRRFPFPGQPTAG